MIKCILAASTPTAIVFIFCPVILWNATACLSTAVNPFIKEPIITEGSDRVLKAFFIADPIPLPNTANLLTEPSAFMVWRAKSSMSFVTSSSLKALAKLPPISLRPFRIPPATPIAALASSLAVTSLFIASTILCSTSYLPWAANKSSFSDSVRFGIIPTRVLAKSTIPFSSINCWAATLTPSKADEALSLFKAICLSVSRTIFSSDKRSF